ncbi:hypothetical protein E2C01_044214 [Portunus trituberculatus]|uniref:Uncharacterized protein n=1 Tax=Portunus trituberculatus TaxID=210409 RepID=A0A5B7FY85_PORTR|nr:hypothetical protein [Portunus trituberculatus]
MDNSGLVFPSPPSEYFMPSIKVLHNDVFHALPGLNPQKGYGADRRRQLVFLQAEYCLAFKLETSV